ncbi:MAG: hypothetical protein M0Z52_07450 [Actinomycetota bacterium]|nr:hypothetical protein [Actinomycetota bacterium]
MNTSKPDRRDELIQEARGLLSKLDAGEIKEAEFLSRMAEIEREEKEIARGNRGDAGTVHRANNNRWRTRADLDL